MKYLLITYIYFEDGSLRLNNCVVQDLTIAQWLVKFRIRNSNMNISVLYSTEIDKDAFEALKSMELLQ